MRGPRLFRPIGHAAVFLLAAACAGCAGEGPVKKTELEAEAPAPEKPAEAVARVNGVEISRDELEARVARIAENREMRAQRKLKPEEIEEYHHQTLAMLIANELLYQEAVRHGYEATPEEIERQLQMEKMKFAEEEHFRKTLKHQGIAMEVFMEDMRRMVMINKLLEEHVFKDMSDITEDDVRAFYDALRKRHEAENPDREPPSYSTMRPQIFLQMEEDRRNSLKDEFLMELAQKSTIDVYE